MKKFLLICLSLVTLAGCADNERHYWQKTDPNTAIYLTGVKAQQTLEQDISECVHLIIELTKLGDTRGQVPSYVQPIGNYDQKQATDEMSRLPLWDVPEYIKDLRVDHSEFHDFDGCMAWKGWDRVRYVGPSSEMRSKEVYDDTANYSVRPRNPLANSDTQMKQLHNDR